MTPAKTTVRTGPHQAAGQLLTATVIAQVLIVVTGGIVRVTGSGLGCPTWPRCTEESFSPVADEVTMWIEFSNRLIALGLVGLCVASLIVLVRRGDAVLTAWAAAQLGGVVAQAVLGGISVLVDLHPLVVAAHLLVSAFLIYAAVTIKVGAESAQGLASASADRRSQMLASAVLATGLVVMIAGALVTASGPYAGDPGAERLGLNEPLSIRFHAVAAVALLGLLVVAAHSLARAHHGPDVRAALVAALGLIVAQLAVGTGQTTAGRPAWAVVVHLLIAAALAAILSYIHRRTRIATTAERSIR